MKLKEIEMCECKADIEKKLTERHQAAESSGREHKVRLQGFGLVVGGGVIRQRPYMEYEAFAYVPLKNGGEKPKKTRGNMFFGFCPFCGEKIATD